MEGGNRSPAKKHNPRAQRRRLQSFFKAYAPQRIANIEEVMREYRGREETLFSTLVKQYGPEPDSDDDESSGMASSTMAVSQLDLRQQHPDEASSSSRPASWDVGTFAAILTAFYSHVDPRMASHAPRDALANFGRELDFFADLHKRFGISPLTMLQARHLGRVADEQIGVDVKTNDHATVVSIGSNDAVVSRRLQFERQLGVYYDTVAPEKARNAPQLAELFGGSDESEAALKERLARQYGYAFDDVVSGRLSPPPPSPRAAITTSTTRPLIALSPRPPVVATAALAPMDVVPLSDDDGSSSPLDIAHTRHRPPHFFDPNQLSSPEEDNRPSQQQEQERETEAKNFSVHADREIDASAAAQPTVMNLDASDDDAPSDSPASMALQRVETEMRQSIKFDEVEGRGVVECHFGDELCRLEDAQNAALEADALKTILDGMPSSTAASFGVPVHCYSAYGSSY